MDDAVNGKHFSTHENIYVTRSRRIYDEPENGQPAAPCRFERETWAARILEIRALDNTHVYLRLFWFYSPDDLPQGRKLYHGDEELIASNDMDIVDACRIVGHAEISHWKETDSDDLPDYGSFYWRQTYDVTTGKLSVRQPHLSLFPSPFTTATNHSPPPQDLETHCICAEPHDPEVPLIRCTNPSCGLRMHQGCIIANHLVTLHEDAAAAPTPTTITTTTTPTPTTTSSKRRARNPPAPHAPRAPRRRTSLHDFNVRIVDLDDPHNHDGHVAPPRMRVEDCRRSKPLVWRREIVCLDCERGLG